MIALAIALVLVLGVVLYRKGFFNKKDEEYIDEEIICPDFSPQWDQSTSPNLANEFDSVGGTNGGNWSTTTIALGDYNHQVAYAQSRLNSQYSAGIKEDGKFGCETFGAVVELTGYDAVNGFDINDLK